MKNLRENITKTYIKPTKKRLNTANKQAKKIAGKLNIDDKIEKMLEAEAYITIKDHKKGFPNDPLFRLIHPSKSDIGRISKNILDKINPRVIQETKVNQWKNTNAVIAWFKSLPDKRRLLFANFDVESFYPSISLNLFQQALDFAREKVDMADTDISIIMQARKTLLFHEGYPWLKQSVNEDFDLPMGSCGDADMCKLGGSFLLNKLSHVIDKSSVGLYREDGLGFFNSFMTEAVIIQKLVCYNHLRDERVKSYSAPEAEKNEKKL